MCFVSGDCWQNNIRGNNESMKPLRGIIPAFESFY